MCHLDNASRHAHSVYICATWTMLPGMHIVCTYLPLGQCLQACTQCVQMCDLDNATRHAHSLYICATLKMPPGMHTVCTYVPRGQCRQAFTQLVHSVQLDNVLLCCYYAFVLPILEYCSPVWGSAAKCHLQSPERQVYSVARLLNDQTFLSLCHQRHIASRCMLYKVHLNSNHYLLSELPFASVSVRHTRAAAVAHPLELERLYFNLM